jgi:hypothetical protein
MKIRYSTGLAVFILVAGAFVLLTSFITGPSVSTFTGSLCLVIGIGYLVRPLAELTESDLTLLALFGPLKKPYPVAQLRVVDGKIYCGEKKVRIAGWVANTQDWRALLERLQRNDG